MSGRHEFPDPTPVEMPLGFKRPPSLQEEIQRLIRVQMSQLAQEDGYESFEEADDFEVDEDPDPLSPYEVVEMQPEAITASETLSGAPQGAAVNEQAAPATQVATPAQNGSEAV